MHECFQIVHIWEKCVEQLQKVVFTSWQQFICESFHQIAEILASMKAYPMYLIIEYHA